MKIGEMRKELESYGMSTKSFLEKKELAEAVVKARAEGKTPIKEPDTASSTARSTATSSSSSSSSTTGESREERIKKEMEKCQSMKVGELKKELETLGISTKSFFEKSEFVKALAEARVDGVQKQQQQRSATGRGAREELYDPEYKDVVMQKFKGDPRLLAGSVIDIRLKP